MQSGRRDRTTYASGITPSGAYSSVGWFESYYSAGGRWFADGACGVGADGAVSQAGGYGGGGASGGASGDVGWVPGVVDFSVVTNDGAAAVGELVEILFAEDEWLRLFSGGLLLGVLGGNAVFKKPAGGGGADAGGVDEVF